MVYFSQDLQICLEWWMTAKAFQSRLTLVSLSTMPAVRFCRRVPAPFLQHAVPTQYSHSFDYEPCRMPCLRVNLSPQNHRCKAPLHSRCWSLGDQSHHLDLTPLRMTWQAKADDNLTGNDRVSHSQIRF